MTGRFTNLIIVGQGPTVFAVGWVEHTFSFVCHSLLLSPAHVETARYKLKYCLKGPLKQNNQPNNKKEMLADVNFSAFFIKRQYRQKFSYGKINRCFRSELDKNDQSFLPLFIFLPYRAHTDPISYKYIYLYT